MPKKGITDTARCDGSIDVNVLNKFSPPRDLFFIRSQALPTALSQPVVIDDYVIELDSVQGVAIGSWVGVFSGESLEGRFYFAEVVGVGVPTANSVRLNSPLDFPFDAGDPVIITSRELNVAGSPEAPSVFKVTIGGLLSPTVIDITRLMIMMTTDTEVDFGRFGDIADGLVNGIVLRRVGSLTRNIWNVKSNGELANLAFDFRTFDATNPGQGVNGVAVSYSLAGQDKHGVAVRLKAGDALELLIRDDLSSLDSFRIIAQGHRVVE